MIDQREVDRLNARLRRITRKAEAVKRGSAFGRDAKLEKLRDEYRKVTLRRDAAKTQEVLDLNVPTSLTG